MMRVRSCSSYKQGIHLCPKMSKPIVVRQFESDLQIKRASQTAERIHAPDSKRGKTWVGKLQ